MNLKDELRITVKDEQEKTRKGKNYLKVRGCEN
jgi:hypothetical protein